MKQRNVIIAALTMLFMLTAGGAMAQWNTNANGIDYMSGNVGIGTTAPAELLHVKNFESYTRAILEGTNTDGLVSNLQMNSSTGEQFVFALKNPGGIYQSTFAAYDGSSWAVFFDYYFNTKDYYMRPGINDMYYQNSGNIICQNGGGLAVNTTYIPSGYKMAVNGKIVCEEILVELVTNWPDYVFEADYHLRSLSETENFIKDNGHLPGIPPENVISENGVHLGEMNVLLLEKIEELTLYIIEQDKRIKSLEEALK